HLVDRAFVPQVRNIGKKHILNGRRRHKRYVVIPGVCRATSHSNHHDNACIISEIPANTKKTVTQILSIIAVN
ncbi:MAG: hypothetical protein ABIJ16_11395, partial [Bacteroidota bacterium]